jgi:site-specific DNA recombinase
MISVVTYCRVSSDEQAEKDISIPAQRKALVKWIEEQGSFNLVREFVDQGQSAYASADKRPAFCEMISFCRKNKIDYILVHKLDRFSRNREESILFKGLLRKSGVLVRSITEHFDPETPAGFLYEGMIEVINQFYSMNLATEVLKGLKENASRGWINGGIAPYGLKKARVKDEAGREHITFEPGDPEHVAIVREIFDLATHHGHGGKTIAAMLNERGVPGPTGRHWQASSINNILANEAYCGDAVWFKSKTSRRSRNRTVTDPTERIVVRNAFPAIIERELFERRTTGAKTRQFRVHENPNRHVNYLLGRLIKCSCCGASFVGRRREYTNHRGEKQETTAYYCSSYLFKGQSVCRSLPVDQVWLDGLVLDAIRARVTAEGWEELASTVRRRIAARRAKYGVDPKAIQVKLAEIDRKIANYYRAIGDGLDPQVCRALVAELQQRKTDIETEFAALQEQDYYTVALEKNMAALEKFRRLFASTFERLPFAVQRQAVLKFVSGIEVRDRKEVVVTLKVNFDNNGLKQLNDEMDTVENGSWTPKAEEASAVTGDASYALSPVCQSGPTQWLGADSNRRHPGYEPSALTN